jgi:hypothetical protein
VTGPLLVLRPPLRYRVCAACAPAVRKSRSAPTPATVNQTAQRYDTFDSCLGAWLPRAEPLNIRLHAITRPLLSASSRGCPQRSDSSLSCAARRGGCGLDPQCLLSLCALAARTAYFAPGSVVHTLRRLCGSSDSASSAMSSSGSTQASSSKEGFFTEGTDGTGAVTAWPCSAAGPHPRVLGPQAAKLLGRSETICFVGSSIRYLPRDAAAAEVRTATQPFRSCREERFEITTRCPKWKPGGGASDGASTPLEPAPLGRSELDEQPPFETGA